MGKTGDKQQEKDLFVAETTMKKFLYEYKAFRSKSESDKFKDGNKGEPPEDMGVFKWLRRERVTVTTQPLSTVPSSEERHSQSLIQIGTIRTEEYKRDLAEFQARRSIGGANDEQYKNDLLEFQSRRSAGKCDNAEYSRNEASRSKHEEYERDLAEFQARRSFERKGKDPIVLPDTPVKRKCGRHSLPVSCTSCATDREHDNTFNYEKKSATKYKKKSERAKSASPEEKGRIGNIQFLFQNQVFMPGNMFEACTATYAESQKPRQQQHKAVKSPELSVPRHIDFEEHQTSSPLFYKNNCLPYDSQQFLHNSKEWDAIDGATKDPRNGSRSSSDAVTDSADLCEAMRELHRLDQWADDQLYSGAKSEDCKSDASAYGLPIAAASDLDVTADENRTWNRGAWGLVPVQVKSLNGVSIDTVQRRLCNEVNILRKCRHPNIILLMGLYQDINSNVHLICEECIDSLYAILHVQGRVLSAQTAVHYALDIANALVFLRMHGYIHTAMTSHAIMITSNDAAKLADLTACERLPKEQAARPKRYDIFSPEPQYVNIQDAREAATLESEPLLSQHSSETYLTTNATPKKYSLYCKSEHYRWHAPELFTPDEQGMVFPCAKSAVYSLCLVLWESCNAAVPWKSLAYEKLHELYTLWHTGIRLQQDGTYPGCLLALLQRGLKLDRAERIDLIELQSTLQSVKRKIDDIEYLIIPARLPKKRSNFSITGWDITTDESECLSPNIQHKAVLHSQHQIDSPCTSEKETKSESSRYETATIQKLHATFTTAEKCYISDDNDEERRPCLKYQLLPDNDFSSACSTPISKIRAKIKDIGTPGALHRSDSTEYCSIISPEGTNLTMNNTVDGNTDKFATKLSRSFTPKSYKPLHIKVPQCNLDSVKSILKDLSGSEKSSYNFDIKNCSLPNTPIARSNKLRKNAWLSGNLTRSLDKSVDCKAPENEDKKTQTQSAPETPATNSCFEKDQVFENSSTTQPFYGTEEHSPDSVDLNRDSFTGLRRIDRPPDYSPETDDVTKTNSWSYKSSIDSTKPKSRFEEDALSNVNVKPLVAIHERWIYEANRKTGRAMSMPDESRCHINAVKPASHCVVTSPNSSPHLNLKRSVPRPFRTQPVSPSSSTSMKNGLTVYTLLTGGHWEQFCQARDTIAKNVNFSSRSPEKLHHGRENDMGTLTDEESPTPKMDQATDTRNIEEFIRELIRKEFQYLMHEKSDDGNLSMLSKHEESISKRVSKIVEHLKNAEEDECAKKDMVKSFSRVKINGNNKPLLQITFSRSGENSLQVLDNCVNVTICETSTSGKEKLNLSLEDPLTEDAPMNSLKRCQAFNALQEARSTEDLYIDDDLSTQLQENFGGKVKLIPLHGSLHEILCEREDDCCLIKVKQENGCDSIYFKCDNSDTESRDAIDGGEGQSQDTVVYKRSISLVEERIERVYPKDNRRGNNVTRRRVETIKTRPKSEVILPKLTTHTRIISNSSPSLVTKGDDEAEPVEVNLENTMCYQDSSSEECLRCQVLTDSDDFELLEKSIEDDLATNNFSIHGNTSPVNNSCLAKISEENLSTVLSSDEQTGNDFQSSRETI